jgi:hypothetical protein
MTNLTRLIARAVTCAGLAAALAAPAATAQAATRDPADLTKHRQQIATRIDERLTSLDKLAKTLTDATDVSRPHRDALGRIIGDHRAGLSRLRAKVMAERTHNELRKDAAALITGHPAFASVGPRVRLVIQADTDWATGVSLDKRRGIFVGRVAKATAAGVNTRAAEASLATLRTSVEQAGKLLRGQADAALSAPPAGFDKIRKTLDAAHERIRAGIAAAHNVRAFLASLPPGKR